MKGLSNATWFRLAAAHDASGVRCDETGTFVGTKPLILHVPDGHGSETWQPCSVTELNEVLSDAYDLPRAQVAALHLHLPDLPRLANGSHPQEDEEDKVKLACLLHQSGVLDTAAYVGRDSRLERRDVSNQPRIPAGQPGGGRWTTDGGDQSPQSPIVPTQAIPLPWGPFIRPLPGVRPVPPGAIRPLPPDILPTLDIPGAQPRDG